MIFYKLMNMNKILSKENENLEFVAERYFDTYSKATPFPHAVFENFFDENFLNKVLDEFPDLSKTQNSQVYMNKNEIKYANNDYQNFPDSIKNFFEFLNSNMYLNFLQKLTSVKEKLIVDPQLNGGGLHEIKKGGVLKIHTDFNKHPSLKLDRRINVLIYLNKDWKDQYGGHLELWDKDMLGCKKKILPTFNKMVIFSTNDFSNHGHPDPVICPLNQSRKSIALYYFSEGRPLEDLDKNHIKNRTYFKNRVGFENDTDNQNDSLKNLIRNLKLFKLMKKLEKKYLRKKKD
jgi:Rps23 Pro-64 3,4-dihydroxylase Tpa1-like proline 4-hydroxylase